MEKLMTRDFSALPSGDFHKRGGIPKMVGSKNGKSPSKMDDN